ncbi:MAG: hypothetical protein COT84_08845, partial [Chlamydiae bacterium CG10_big_fil_rev_8_21_14_0_10_35_9]
MNFSYKLIKNGKLVNKCRTHSIRRFTKNLRTIRWRKSVLKVYLKVNYGKGFINEGLYENQKDLWAAFNAFVED